MASPSISTQSKSGFTLIEIIITIGLISIIATFGLFLSWDYYRGTAFLSEQKIVVSILQKARNQSMSNINEKPHGVFFDPGCYIIFEGTYDGTGCSSSTNEVINVQPTITPSGMSKVIFDQLSGAATVTGGNLTLTGNGKTTVIKVASNGQIDVQ